MLARLSLIVLLFVAIPLYAQSVSEPTPEDVALHMQRVADWQIKHFRDTFSSASGPLDIRSWTHAPFYVGLLKWNSITSDTRYLEWAKHVASSAKFKLNDRTYLADDHAVGQLYLELYRQYGEADMIEHTQRTLDYLLAHPSEEPITLDNYTHLERWTWCDALFMAPPVWAKLSAITGDARYREWMMSELKHTVDHLYDRDEGLFYRDNSFLDKRINGKKVFWSRGNGWVFAGLTLIMDELPEDSPEYSYLMSIYLEMANALVKIQTEQGHWSMSLLDPEGFPTPETSGTAFFTFGLAWGVNQKILDDEKFRNAIFKGWSALSSHVNEEGMLGYVQPVGAAPGDAWPDKTEIYGSGAFLAAGAEVFRLVGGAPPAKIQDSKALARNINQANRKLEKELKIFNDPKRKRAFARRVPERKDDFAWENDLVAFRAYGPALRDGPEDAGVDCWLKRVKYPIINKWYSLSETKDVSYHIDHGEGLDNYHVGSSAGCGGTALWLNGKRESLETYTRASVQKNTADVVVFTLTYHKSINGDHYSEVKRITLPMGTRMYAVESTFRKNGVVIEGLPIAIGITTHDGKAKSTFHAKAGWLAAWEKVDGYGLGTGIYVDATAIIDTISIFNEDVPDSSHALFIVNTNSEGKVFYFAGYGWGKSDEIISYDAWQAYLDAFPSESVWKM